MNEINKRDWGWWHVLVEKEPSVKVKELILEPGGALSFQRHLKRNEHWFVLKGKFILYLEDEKSKSERVYNEYETCVIPQSTWHQGCNPFDEPCSILEVQYGQLCVEEDIERRHARI